MPIMQVIDMAAMLDSGMTTTFAVLVVMVFVVLFFTCSHLVLQN